jgi:LuxR family transcriptional regulator, maltose regulon positive regulatory protein
MGHYFLQGAKNLMVKAVRPKPLTARQHSVLRLIAQGQTTGEIASQLGVTPNTVRDHIRLILAKLHARDRAHAVAIAMREGLLR